MAMPHSVKDYATFGADLPDDAVWNENEDLVKPGGAAIAEQLRAALANRGLATSEVHQHSHYGWAFEASRGKESVWCMVQQPGHWLLITEVRGNALGRLLRRGPSETQEVVLGILRETLAAPPFKSASWMTAAEYNESGWQDSESAG